ncbi:GNAT family N-acetyltransferase [Streptomyces sp. NPDC006333]|uniref:GNAT family N-acetyltransferase n=1 Tax=Streptomyces sp. NPDC006333 TaxID=3156753 RepID=UPI0033BEE488
MTTLTVRGLRGPEAMDLLTGKWRELYAEDRSATPFQSSDWLTAWARRLPYTATPLVLTAVSPTGRIVAALPLARHEDRMRPRITPLSTPYAPCLRPIGPHANDPAVARAFTFHLLLAAEQEDAEVALESVDADSPLGHALHLVSADISWTRTASAHTTILLPVRYDTLSPSVQREHARRRRTWTRLVTDHAITYTRTRHLKDLLSTAKVWEDLQRGHGPLQHDAETGDWQSVLEKAGAATACIAVLRIDDHVIAAQLCLTRGPHCYTLPLVADPAHRHLAPGHALLRHLVDDLAADGIHTLHLDPTTSRHHASRGQYGAVRPDARAAQIPARSVAA